MSRASTLAVISFTSALLVGAAVPVAQTCPYDPQCLNNPYGAGSPYKSDGLMNPYSQYGSPYSNKSWNNPYATDAPRIGAEVPNEEVRVAIGQKYAHLGQDPREIFLKPLFHRIVCIGAVFAERDHDGPFSVRSIGARHVGEKDERIPPAWAACTLKI